MASDKGLSFQIKKTVSASVIKGDRQKINQILINLCGNAVKFTQKGGVTLEARQDTGGSDKQIRINFLVSDTGKGISPHKLDTIFEKFTQEDSSITRKFGGTGLGLSISKNFVEMMGGKLVVESTQGKGSTFSFGLDFELASQEEAMQFHKTSPANLPESDMQLSVLVAEDNPVNREIVKAFLERQNHHVTTAENGLETLALLEANAVDMILMDIQMPIMDGFETVKKIRSSPEGTAYKHIPIIALTAHALQGDREKILSSGMDGYVTKPIDPARLCATIKQVRSCCAQLASPTIKINAHYAENAPSLLDTDMLITRLDGDIGLVIALYTLFLETSGTEVSSLLSAIQSRDADQIRFMSHRLKGAASNIAAMQLAQLCETMEQLAMQKDMDAIVAIKSDFKKTLHDTCEAIKIAFS